MSNRAELEQQLVQEIHYLPIEAIESLLKLACLIKKESPVKPLLQSDNFADVIRNSPLMEVDLDLNRDQSLCRDIEL